jgi:hypothetical protein
MMIVTAPRSMVALVPFAAICLLLLGLLGAAPAEAKTLATPVGYGYANYDAHTDSRGYYGSLRDTTDTDAPDYCVEMQRKNADGDWVVSGFSAGLGHGGADLHVVACGTTFVDWNIADPDTVYGLRMRDASGTVGRFCNSQEACLAIVNS